ncbi:hypothetical protein D3C85_1542210 [compost metagenome]
MLISPNAFMTVNGILFNSSSAVKLCKLEFPCGLNMILSDFLFISDRSPITVTLLSSSVLIKALLLPIFKQPLLSTLISLGKSKTLVCVSASILYNPCVVILIEKLPTESEIP